MFLILGSASSMLDGSLDNGKRYLHRSQCIPASIGFRVSRLCSPRHTDYLPSKQVAPAYPLTATHTRWKHSHQRYTMESTSTAAWCQLHCEGHCCKSTKLTPIKKLLANECWLWIHNSMATLCRPRKNVTCFPATGTTGSLTLLLT